VNINVIVVLFICVIGICKFRDGCWRGCKK